MKSLIDLVGAVNLRGPILPQRTYLTNKTQAYVLGNNQQSPLYSECDCSECGGGDCTDCDCTSDDCDDD